MIQLDIFIFSVNAFWIIIGLFVIYIIFLKWYIIKIAQILKIRKLTLTQNKIKYNKIYDYVISLVVKKKNENNK